MILPSHHALERAQERGRLSKSAAYSELVTAGRCGLHLPRRHAQHLGLVTPMGRSMRRGRGRQRMRYCVTSEWLLVLSPRRKGLMVVVTCWPLTDDDLARLFVWLLCRVALPPERT